MQNKHIKRYEYTHTHIQTTTANAKYMLSNKEQRNLANTVPQTHLYVFTESDRPEYITSLTDPPEYCHIPLYFFGKIQ